MDQGIGWKCFRAMIALGALLATGPSLAHHSTSMYDYTTTKTLTGTVKEFEWTNPHMFIQMMVLNAQGTMEEWSIECGTPNINVRHGWKKTDLRAGDKVTVDISPLRDGSDGGTLKTVTLADGRVLFGPGNDIVSGPTSGDPASTASPPAQN